MRKTIPILFSILFCLFSASCAGGSDPGKNAVGTLPPETAAYSDAINLEALGDEAGTLSEGVYSNPYITFSVPADYFLERVENVDTLSPSALSGAFISVTVGDRTDLSALTEEKLESDFSAFYPGAEVSDLRFTAVGDLPACAFAVSVEANGKRIALYQILIDAGKCVTLTFTDPMGDPRNVFSMTIGSLSAA